MNVVPLKDLYSAYSGHYEAHFLQHSGGASQAQRAAFKRAILKAMDGWLPEAAVVFTTPLPAVNDCWPDSLNLQFENGGFSCQLDPFGFLARSYPCRFAGELRKARLTALQRARIRALRAAYASRIFDRHNPVSRKEFGGAGRKVLLVPLSYSGAVINDAASRFKSQQDLLLHVLQELPENVLVLATKHKLQAPEDLPRETEEFLAGKFPNLRLTGTHLGYASPSQWLTPLVDGVVSLNSTVAYHAALWGKKVFALGKCEINSVSTADNLRSAAGILVGGDRDDPAALAVLYHLLTRQSFPLRLFHDPAWLTRRLAALSESARTGELSRRWTSLPLIDDEDAVFERLLQETPGLAENFKPQPEIQQPETKGYHE